MLADQGWCNAGVCVADDQVTGCAVVDDGLFDVGA